MRILFVSMVAFENNSSATIQNKGIIKGLYELEHEVDILTLRPDERNVSFDDSMNDIENLINKKYYIEIDSRYANLMAKKNNNKISKTSNKEAVLLKLILDKGRTMLKKVFDNISIFDAMKVNVKGVSKLDINYDKYDIIISASDPKSSHLIVGRIYKDNPNCKVQWIQYWGDPMYNDITRKSDWRNILVKYSEKKLISKTNRVVYASPLTLKSQKRSFSDFAHKMDYASQVYIKVDEIDTRNATKVFVESINAGYFGAYRSNIRNIIPLYNALKNTNIKLDISGSSDINLTDTDNITVHGMLPYNVTLDMEENTDILVCICNSKGTQIPGKIYYCTGYNKPIIVILDGEYKDELRAYLERFERFILCDNTEMSIIEAFEQAKKQLIDQYKYIIHEQLTPKFMATKIMGEIAKVN